MSGHILYFAPVSGKNRLNFLTHYDAKGKSIAFATCNILWNKPKNDDLDQWQTYFYRAAR
jgi:hypothetical protein